MACRATFSFTETLLGETPLDDAVYVPSVNKIFGMVGPHIARFNAVTGAFETAVRVVGPAMGNCRICYHAPLDTIFASVWNILNKQWSTEVWPARGIYPINPATMAIGAVINTDSFATLSRRWSSGPMHVFSPGAGDQLYFTQWNSVGVYMWRVNPTNIADRFHPNDGITFDGDNSYHQYCTDGTHMYGANTYDAIINQFDMALTNGSSDGCEIVPPEQFVDNPVSVAWSTSESAVYAVCGTPTLIKATNFVAPGAYTPFQMNSATVTGMPALTAVKPVRIRSNTAGTLLYIPCQEHNAVIVWDTSTDDGVWKSGFFMPCDVVLTGTKVFAVQLGSNGLQEIT